MMSWAVGLLFFVFVLLMCCALTGKSSKEGLRNKAALLERPKNATGLRKQILTVRNTDEGKPWNDRKAFVYLPNTPKPSGGYPYVLYFSFMDYDGSSKQTTPSLPGLVNLDKAAPCTKAGQCNGETSIWIQMLLQLLLNSGVAVIMTTMTADDSYFYVECQADDEKDLSNPYNICWNGYNPDKKYLRKLFGLIETDQAFPGVTSSLNYNECGLLGYSVGAQMVSRCYNEFPYLKTLPGKAAFPKIKAGMMVSGGSMHCYQYCNGDAKSRLRGPDGPLCARQPSTFAPCVDQKGLGCCPRGLTEPNYDSGRIPWSQHPPTLLAQTVNDSFADPNASALYYDALQKHGVASELITGLGSNHNLFPAAVIPALDFFSKYLQVGEGGGLCK